MGPPIIRLIFKMFKTCPCGYSKLVAEDTKQKELAQSNHSMLGKRLKSDLSIFSNILGIFSAREGVKNIQRGVPFSGERYRQSLVI